MTIMHIVGYYFYIIMQVYTYHIATFKQSFSDHNFQ